LELKSLSLVDAYASPNLIGFCDCAEGNTYVKLMTPFDGINFVDWPFQFFDIENTCNKLEGFNRFFGMYMFYH